MKAIVVVCSYHHKNTEIVAKRIAETLGAQTVTPQQVSPLDASQYDLIGLGSGVYGMQHHTKLLEFAEKLPAGKGNNVFLFSTDGVPKFMVNTKFKRLAKTTGDHEALRKILINKGYTVVGEFACLGYNTNSFLKYFGGFNKGKPDETDLANAADFANSLLEYNK